VHGRQGHMMVAISAVDCALWDLRGLAFGQPVWRILGGPTREEVPAYASMLGFAVEDLGKVRERATAYKAMGYTAQKWFFRHGPMSGYEGLKKNVDLVRTVREAVGDDYDIMFDCWQSFNLDYAVDLAARIAEYRPRWLEECFMPDRIDSHVKLKAKTTIPLSGAEHEYTRWGFKRFVEKDALDVLQPDIYWSGGLSEVLKIAAYATTHDLITIPHGHSTPMTIHFSAAQSPIHTPYQEYLVKWNAIHMHFLKTKPEPENGVLRIPRGPGVGMTLDPDKIESEEEVTA
jgi:L-rhamnonate dehydratase